MANLVRHGSGFGIPREQGGRSHQPLNDRRSYRGFIFFHDINNYLKNSVNKL